jgi:UDP-2-acetamido-2-deoxy-ribo-hexuluronate aminotransferase
MIKLVNLYQEYKLIKAGLNKRLLKLHTTSSYVQNSDVKMLEFNLAKFKGSNYCSTCASGTDALILALKSLNLDRGSEVLVPAYSWISTASAVLLNNLKIKFIDIDIDTACLNINEIGKNITKKTKAIILVDLYGNCVQSNKLKKICEENNIFLIIDGAQSLGSINQNEFYHIYTTSFFPAKSLGCFGDGGACFTNDKKIFDKIQILSRNGQRQRYDSSILGLNSRLDSLQASVLLEKLKYYKNFLKKRKNASIYYFQKLKDFPLKMIINLNQSKNACTNFPILIDNRDEFIKFMKKKSIEIGKNYPLPLTKQKAFKEFSNNKKFANADNFAKKIATLPLNPFLTKKDQDYIIDNIDKYFEIYKTK